MSTNTATGSKRADLAIIFNGQEINLENVPLSTAKHHPQRQHRNEAI